MLIVGWTSLKMGFENETLRSENETRPRHSVFIPLRDETDIITFVHKFSRGRDETETRPRLRDRDFMPASMSLSDNAVDPLPTLEGTSTFPSLHSLLFPPSRFFIIYSLRCLEALKLSLVHFSSKFSPCWDWSQLLWQ